MKIRSSRTGDAHIHTHTNTHPPPTQTHANTHLYNVRDVRNVQSSGCHVRANEHTRHTLPA